MALTASQLLALKTAINANVTWAAFAQTSDGYADLAAALNVVAAPNFWVWATNVAVQDIKAAIVWANLTPADAPDNTVLGTNRFLQCQSKQFNIQLILPMTGTFNGSIQTLRDGLQDALTGIRSGVGGVAQDGGWVAVRNVLARKATFAEKILADTTNGDGSTRALSALMAFEGTLTALDVQLARTS